MVRPIGHVKFVCKQCGWTYSNHYKSDVIDDRPHVCPECSNEDLRFEVEEYKSLLVNLLKWLNKA